MENENSATCECCGRLDLGRINTGSYPSRISPSDRSPGPNPPVQRPRTDLTIRRTWRTLGCDSPFDRISATAEIPPLATTVVDKTNWIFGFVRTRPGRTQSTRAEIRTRVETLSRRTRSSLPLIFLPGYRNSPSEKIFQQRRRNGTLIRVHFVLKLLREKWQFITFISLSSCPRFLVKANVIRFLLFIF